MPAPDADRRALADAVRALVDAVVAADAPVAAVTAARDAVAQATALLVPHVPAIRRPRYGAFGGDATASDLMPYDPIIGGLSPLAPPLETTVVDGKVRAHVRFGTPYEGPPGCVHGGIIAACFDQVLNVANLVQGVAGPTKHLGLRFRKPTPLLADVVFEAWVSRTEERHVHTHGRLLAGDVVTVEAEGTFALIPIERIVRLLDP